MAIHCFAAFGKKEPLKPFEYEPRPLEPYDLFVRIQFCGMCHSDLHLINDDWGISHYPLVPGHEIVGTVEKTGGSVRGLEKGQRVGVGWQCGACHDCELCVSGKDNLCAGNKATCVGNFGGYGDGIVVDSRFAFPLPENLEAIGVAPLLCGGITVFSPLLSFDVRPEMAVGVVGVGGLGHLALQFASAFGCKVTAFSGGKAKEKDARRLGAELYVDSSKKEELAAAASSQDFIICTASADLDWPALINTLRPEGKLCVVGVPPNDLHIPAMPLIVGRRSVCGSPIGSRGQMRVMLAFAARHGIAAEVEVFPMVKVNDALARLAENKARYRLVLENKMA